MNIIKKVYSNLNQVDVSNQIDGLSARQRLEREDRKILVGKKARATTGN